MEKGRLSRERRGGPDQSAGSDPDPEPEPSCVSFKSDRSKEKIQQQRSEYPEPEPSCVSFKCDWSKDLPETFKDEHQSVDPRRKLEEPEPRCVSMKSDLSKGLPVASKDGRPSVDQRVDQEISEVLSGQSAKQHQTHLDSSHRRINKPFNDWVHLKTVPPWYSITF
ncbi:procyclic form-specific polypeptide B1-alpha-like [Perca fluviatilis]|uniref:procyclic form-specific polypeptide B1-alpha-like n=1 Tax=Perca fluviatilis TaxID=8168 RepID=UPI00196666BB|nr:procyclic form-specific polypeptide B1-alpha-like [Perca fluviatilis]